MKGRGWDSPVISEKVVITKEAVELQRGKNLKQYQDKIVSLKDEIEALEERKTNLEKEIDQEYKTKSNFLADKEIIIHKKFAEAESSLGKIEVKWRELKEAEKKFTDERRAVDEYQAKVDKIEHETRAKIAQEKKDFKEYEKKVKIQEENNLIQAKKLDQRAFGLHQKEKQLSDKESNLIGFKTSLDKERVAIDNEYEVLKTRQEILRAGEKKAEIQKKEATKMYAIAREQENEVKEILSEARRVENLNKSRLVELKAKENELNKKVNDIELSEQVLKQERKELDKQIEKFNKLRSGT